MTAIVLYCRPGFEKECGAEIQEKASWNEVYGYLQLSKNQGLVYFHLNKPEEGEMLMEKYHYVVLFSLANGLLLSLKK